MIAETLLRPAAEEDGGSGVHSPRSVAELHTGLEVRLPGQHEWRGLHPWGSVCHRTGRPGSVANIWTLGKLYKTCLYFNDVLCSQGILLEHREKEFGDKVDVADVLEFAKQIVPVK